MCISPGGLPSWNPTLLVLSSYPSVEMCEGPVPLLLLHELGSAKKGLQPEALGQPATDGGQNLQISCECFLCVYQTLCKGVGGWDSPSLLLCFAFMTGGSCYHYKPLALEPSPSLASPSLASPSSESLDAFNGHQAEALSVCLSVYIFCLSLSIIYLYLFIYLSSSS